MKDVLIIGGGVIGTFIAYELSKTHANIVLLEKERQLGQVQTKHNSALIHSPVMVPPSKGVLKARFAKEGNEMYQSLVETLHIPHLKNGAYVLALDEDDMNELNDMLKEAKQRKIPAHFVSIDVVKQTEKYVSNQVIGALALPTAMTADTTVLCQTLAQKTKEHGAKVLTNRCVCDIHVADDGFTVYTKDGSMIKTKQIINAAGIHADDIAAMVETRVPYQIKPQKGEYMVLPASHQGMIKHTLFPVPKQNTKGILAIPQPDGTIRLGPTNTPQKSKNEALVTSAGMAKIKTSLNQMIHHLPYDQVVQTYAGLRSSLDDDDFFIERSKEYPNFIHVAGIDSPGVTAAPAIAKHVINMLLNQNTAIKKTR